MSKKFLAIHFVLMALLAAAAGYRVPDLSRANWDTVLFLTPYGILNNYFSQNVLWSFYGDISAGQLELGGMQTGFLGLIYLVLAEHMIYFLTRGAK